MLGIKNYTNMSQNAINVSERFKFKFLGVVCLQTPQKRDVNLQHIVLVIQTSFNSVILSVQINIYYIL